MTINDEQYQLFFDTHYELKVKQSLRPVFSSRGMSFPVSYSYHRKVLTLIGKLRYYLTDFKMWYETRKLR